MVRNLRLLLNLFNKLRLLLLCRQDIILTFLCLDFDLLYRILFLVMLLTVVISLNLFWLLKAVFTNAVVERTVLAQSHVNLNTLLFFFLGIRLYQQRSGEGLTLH